MLSLTPKQTECLQNLAAVKGYRAIPIIHLGKLKALGLVRSVEGGTSTGKGYANAELTQAGQTHVESLG